jgi:class 3 adenylate cyclase
MAAPAADSGSTTPQPTLASVIVLKLREFTRQPVIEQVRLKALLETLVRVAIEPLPAAGRAVLDVPDGLALVVLGSPGQALDLALRAQAAGADLPLCIGVNHGPVKAASEALRGHGLVGDGLASGVTLANAAAPGRLVASRSFREALKDAAPARATELRRAGVYTDANVRTHELFTLDRRSVLARRWPLIVFGTLTVAAIIGAGFAARHARLDVPPIPEPPPVRPAVIHLAITPRGDVYIDGMLQGSSPPLTEIEVYPGPHTIEVRNAANPPLRLELRLGSGEEMTITHSFVAPKPQAASPPKKSAPKSAPKNAPKKEKPPERNKTPGDYWRQFRRDAGF